MGAFFRRMVMPWRAAGQFASQEEFFAFLRRYNRVVGAVRTVLLLAAAMLTGYALDLRKINLIAAGALALVMLISLPVLQNEKLLPKEEAKS